MLKEDYCIKITGYVFLMYNQNSQRLLNLDEKMLSAAQKWFASQVTNLFLLDKATSDFSLIFIQFYSILFVWNLLHFIFM